ncbi:MAG: HAD family hydrolase [Anaerolineae bacterium]
MTHDTLLQELHTLADAGADSLLAQTHAPLLRFDAKEPFFPLAVGYTIFRSAAKSPSSKFSIDPEGGIAIEYAVWWDWEIQHLYELEHVWVYLDANGTLAKVEASAHGTKYPMLRPDDTLPLENGRVTVYSEPGKHGFVPVAQSFESFAGHIITCCSERAGEDNILTSNPFGAAAFGNPTAFEHRLARRYMQRLAFTPTFDFNRIFDLRDVPFLTWDKLQTWIPRRINWWREQLPQRVPHLRLICLDSGDTLVDEATEVKNGDVTQHASLIPGAADMVRGLQAAGYRLALVADGPVATFENVLRQQYGLWDAFSAFAISETVGVEKPDTRMFHAALNAFDIPQGDYDRVVMVGNNLERDIKGANALGLISVWISWSPRRSHIPADASEVPDHTIATPLELLDLLEKIELSLPQINQDAT